jgi:hypothetical protein
MVKNLQDPISTEKSYTWWLAPDIMEIAGRTR